MPDATKELRELEVTRVKSGAFTIRVFLEDKKKLSLIRSTDSKLQDLPKRKLSSKTIINLFSSNNKWINLFAYKPTLVAENELISSNILAFHFNNIPKGYYVFEINLEPAKHQEFSVLHYISSAALPVNPQQIEPTNEGKLVFMINHQTEDAVIHLVSQGKHLEFAYFNTEISKVN